MRKSGQITLVGILLLFSGFQKIVEQKDFFTVDFFIFTIIAWFLGYQYDKARHCEKKIRANELSYKKLVDSLPDPVYISSNYNILYANQAAVRIARVKSKDELIGNSLLDFIVPEYQERALERYKQINKEKSPINTIEYKAKRPDGSTFFFEVSSMSISFGGQEAVLSIGKDISERKEQTEKLLQKSEKLALLGQMAAGIAHEIRNPLTSIRGFIQLFKSGQTHPDFYDIVLSELDRINSIVSEFLVLAKPTAAVFIEKDVKNLIKDVVTLINTQSSLNNVQINVEFDSELPKVMCEENQLKQVFLNLLKNAIEAMPKGGNIEVKTRQKEEGKISILIIDQGVGIPEDRIPTLGEPFYTTKEKGTGLGLMTCYKIIESHNGEIKITSVVDEGTTVEITLPTITQPLLVVS
ncbi:ATP-binding protein [Bacillus xiapuensis]|uniref:histidine kinase n=1 Tax=Bacillus xiapuensis TaxID=2014075 RepID=A0ABU6NFB5_9BACI|nr:ATP-binding protein [Bacillus xiapuensis]